MGPTSGTAEQLDEIRVHLAPEPASVARARRAVRDLLEDGGRPDLVERAVLLVSELVTNALLHAGTPFVVTARLGACGIRVEVVDGSPHLPSRRRYAATAGTGRGLMMLESMAADWGVSRRLDGKTVWFEVAQDDDGGTSAVGSGESRPEVTVAEPGAAAAEPLGSGDTVRVELLNLPLLLHAA
ncbi:MAG: ATP-binding protein [Actinomycetes bacterium]